MQTEPKRKPILCIDFDGVIHQYSEGWKGGEIYDDPTVGFFAWARKAQDLFQLVVYSSRSKTDDGLAAMRDWFNRHATEWCKQNSCDEGIAITFAHEKPPAFLTIDDRAICFNGYWHELEPAELLKFKPWTMAR